MYITLEGEVAGNQSSGLDGMIGSSGAFNNSSVSH